MSHRKIVSATPYVLPGQKVPLGFSSCICLLSPCIFCSLGLQTVGQTAHLVGRCTRTHPAAPKRRGVSTPKFGTCVAQCLGALQTSCIGSGSLWNVLVGRGPVAHVCEETGACQCNVVTVSVQHAVQHRVKRCNSQGNASFSSQRE